MTPQEEQLLQSLVERINSTQLQEKDPDAESFLNQNLASNPDAIYILAQTVLIENIALEQAKAQIAQLQQRAQQPQAAHATSFLGNLLGRHDPPQTQPASAASAPVSYPQSSGFQSVQQGPFQPVQQAPAQYSPGYPTQYAPAAPAGPSFLRGAMQTAAGVAAGALAFEGVESVLHALSGGYGMGAPGFGMGSGLMGAGFERPEETVINNYYDQPGGEHREGGEQHLRESADQSGAQFSDAGYNTTGDDRNFDDQSNFDNSNRDDSPTDDSGNFDDRGSFDDSSDAGGNDFGGDSNFQ
jgi:uncharacterized protein